MRRMKASEAVGTRVRVTKGLHVFEGRASWIDQVGTIVGVDYFSCPVDVDLDDGRQGSFRWRELERVEDER